MWRERETRTMDGEDSSSCSKQRGLEVHLRPGWKGGPWLSRGRRIKAGGVWNDGGANGLCVDSLQWESQMNLKISMNLTCST